MDYKALAEAARKKMAKKPELEEVVELVSEADEFEFNYSEPEEAPKSKEELLKERALKAFLSKSPK